MTLSDSIRLILVTVGFIAALAEVHIAPIGGAAMVVAAILWQPLQHDQVKDFERRISEAEKSAYAWRKVAQAEAEGRERAKVG